MSLSPNNNMKKQKIKEVSDCCNAEVRVGGGLPDFETDNQRGQTCYKEGGIYRPREGR
jgi:hypothetical protein